MGNRKAMQTLNRHNCIVYSELLLFCSTCSILHRVTIKEDKKHIKRKVEKSFYPFVLILFCVTKVFICWYITIVTHNVITILQYKHLISISHP